LQQIAAMRGLQIGTLFSERPLPAPDWKFKFSAY
jgi:hypothetical protein